MIPGIAGAMELRLEAAMQSSVTSLSRDVIDRRHMELFASNEPEAAALGIEHVAGPPIGIVVTDPQRRLGGIKLQSVGRNNVMFFDNAGWGGNCFASLRIIGSDCLVFFGDVGGEFVAIHDVLMRSNGQLLFWGTGASAVGISIEMEGEDVTVAIGDDALISSGVWIRTYDMHAIHDLASGARINRGPRGMVMERHVWLGQDALLLSCERIGTGSIIGARALVNATVPPLVAVGGTPARVLKQGVSWGRHSYGMTDAERVAIGVPPIGAAPPA